MADLKISQLNAITTLTPATDVLPVVDVTGTTKKITTNQILGSGGTATLASATITGAATVGTTLGVTGVSTFAAGTAVSPALTTTGDINTGIYYPAADTFAVTTGGIERYRVDSNGNIGVNVTPTNLAGHKRVEIKGDIADLILRTVSANAAARDWQVACNLDAFGELNFRQGASQGADPNSGTTRMVLTASGDVSVSTGNVILGTSGKGIDFSATASGSGTMTSELLNDYEEGTWTGTIQGGTTNPTTPVTATGRYTKVGRVVTVNIEFRNVSTVGASGYIYIGGLPFANNTTYRHIGSAMIGPGATFSQSLCSNIDDFDSGIIFRNSATGASISNANHDAGTGRSFFANITYTV